MTANCILLFPVSFPSDPHLLLHSDNNPSNQSKVCFIRFRESVSVPVSQHLTNTVFIDRAIIVQPYTGSSIPDAATALSQTSGISLNNGGSNSGLISQIVAGVGGTQVISTIDPRLSALGLPQYPPLPANTDPSRVEEIRRTIYVGNMDSKIPADMVLEFFNSIGEVKYVRMAGDESQPTRFAFIEFTDQSTVANALQYNGVSFAGRPLKINHSNNAIVKHVPVPGSKSSNNHTSAAAGAGDSSHHHHSSAGLITQHRSKPESVEEAMRRVREAESQIAAAIDYPAPREKSLAAQDPERRRREEERKIREQERAARHRDRERDRDRDRGDRDKDRDRNGRSDHHHRDRDRDRDRDRSDHHSSGSGSHRSSRRSRSRDRVSDSSSSRRDRHRSSPSSKTSPSSSSHRRSSKRDRTRSRSRERRSEKSRREK